MKKTVKAFIYSDGQYYCAKCFEIDVFTQGESLDAVIKNLKEAVSLHLEGVSPAEYGLRENPSLLIMIEEELQLSHA